MVWMEGVEIYRRQLAELVAVERVRMDRARQELDAATAQHAELVGRMVHSCGSRSEAARYLGLSRQKVAAISRTRTPDPVRTAREA